MRLLHKALLGLVFVLAVSPELCWVQAQGQSPQIDNAQSQLVQAFLLVQEANAAGAPLQQVLLLSDNLNLALAYQQNATRLSGKDNAASNLYAEQSANLSNATAVKASTLEQEAHRQSILNQAAGFSLAFAAAFGSSLFAFEIDRLSNLIRKLRMRRMRFG